MFATFDLIKWLPAGLSLFVSLVLIKLAFNIFYKEPAKNQQTESSWLKQILFFGFVTFCVVTTIVLMPISIQTRGQVFNLLGIAITAVIALSSTSFVGNLMAALMLKAINSIRAGDFLKVGDHFGRVTEQGLLHTEIQTEERTLTTLPNLFLITNPYTVVRSTGTVITCTVSLGYDVSRHKIEKALIEAATKSGLKDAYVQILELGDFSVSYKVSGLLDKVKFLLSSRSSLRAHVLDELHESGIEIVSPNFMNQRVLDKRAVFVPEKSREEENSNEGGLNSLKLPEDLIFDKAEEAQSKESIKELLKKIEAKIDEVKAKVLITESEKDKESLQKRIESLEQRAKRLNELLTKAD